MDILQPEKRKKHFINEQFCIFRSQTFLAEAVAASSLTSANIKRFIFQNKVANKTRLLCLRLLAPFWLTQSGKAQRQFWFQARCISLPLTHIIKWLPSQILCSANFILKINYMATALYSLSHYFSCEYCTLKCVTATFCKDYAIHSMHIHCRK